MSITTIIAVIGGIVTEIATLFGIVISHHKDKKKSVNGIRCLLRSEMLRIYYNHREQGKIRQYEYENFVYLYEAYKEIKGNSFIDKIYKELQEWEVIS